MLRLRILALFVGATLLLSTAPAFAKSDEPSYLALGDSIAFGFNPLVSFADAENFLGYPEALAKMLGIDVANASCPGEASGGFISLTGKDNGCRDYRFLAHFPLHVDYDTAQLDFAVAYLRDHRKTRLVTIDIGINDLLLLVKTCLGDAGCVVAGLPALLQALGANLQTIYSGIRAAGFHGELVALTYYATNFADPVQVLVIGALNRVVAGAAIGARGRVANGYAAFEGAAAPFGGSSCAAGLLIRLTSTTCDDHPSPKGRDLLAAAIKTVLEDQQN
jgi:lysophospholipase L1-like esterase